MSKQKKPAKASFRFATVAEVCEEMGVCVATLGSWVEKGEFPPPMRLGLRKRVWLRMEIETYIQQRTAEAAQSNEKV